MKTQKIIFSILLLSGLTFAGFNGLAQLKSAQLQAAGLTCAMCTKAINNSLERLSFIQKVKVDIKNSAFVIDFKEDAKVDIDALKNAVEDAGFSVASLKIKADFTNVKIGNDQHVKYDNKVFHFLRVKDQVLNGTKTITLVDKDFLTAKQFKSYAASTQMVCVQTGKAGSCCLKEGIPQQTRIYHVTI